MHVGKSNIKWICEKQTLCKYRDSLRNRKYCTLTDVRLTSKFTDQVLNVELRILVATIRLWMEHGKRNKKRIGYMSKNKRDDWLKEIVSVVWEGRRKDSMMTF